MQVSGHSFYPVFPAFLMLIGLVLTTVVSGIAGLLAPSVSVPIGSRAPEWQAADWLNSRPLKLADLRGKVVLVRWWTEGCPFCRATAPALNEFYDQFHSRGLEIVGLYHHKSRPPMNADRVHQYAKNLGFKFPVAIDHQWRTLKEWWLDGSDQQWTSVSFLIDRRGIVRHIHPGGQYVKGDDDYRVMKRKIEELLAE